MRIITANEFLTNFQARTILLDEFFEQEEKVKEIVRQVYLERDEALLKYTRLFDCPVCELDELVVSEEEIDLAYRWCEENEPDFLKAIRKAYENIKEFHEKQIEKSWFYNTSNGSTLGQIITPLKRVGIYVPGGRASYPSTVLMCVIPAKVAGVEEIVMVSPPDRQGRLNKYILTAARICGVEKIFKVGGAQAIAALAFGTKILPKVDKIVGPGNIYVALAKKLLFGVVDIDSVAGPSEIAIIADESANPRFIAFDLLAQAEHDPLARTFLITNSNQLASKVSEEIQKLLFEEPNEVASKSLEKYGLIILVEELNQAINVVESISPEHVELICKNWEELWANIKSAGAIFIGEFSPEAIGDYIAGPNHVLPTQGTARFFSVLGVHDFIRRTSLIKYSKTDFLENYKHAVNLARAEGLHFHAKSLEVRNENVSKRTGQTF